MEHDANPTGAVTIDDIEKLIASKQYGRAFNHLQELLAANPHDTDLLNNMAVVQIVTEQWEDAVRSLQTVLKIEPDNQVALENIQHLENELRLRQNIIDAAAPVQVEPSDPITASLDKISEMDPETIDTVHNLPVVQTRDSKSEEPRQESHGTPARDASDEAGLDNMVCQKDESKTQPHADGSQQKHDTVLLSVVLQGKNDGYMGNFEWRISTNINKLVQSISENGFDDEVQIILVDWGSEQPLAEVLTLSEQAREHLDLIHVSESVADKYNRDSEYSIVHAINTGIRRASGEYILFCDGDTYIPTDSLRGIMSLLRGQMTSDVSTQETLFMASRYHIPKSFQQNSPSLEEIDTYIAKNQAQLDHDKIDLVNFSGTATAYLMSRTLWHECTAFDESLIYWGWFDIDLFHRIKSKYQMVDFEDLGIPFYHLEHYSNSKNRDMQAENPRKINPAVMPSAFSPNGPNWGLLDEDLSISKVGRQYKELQEKVAKSELNKIIPPEIKHDEFYNEIVNLARRKEIQTVLEIGSSAGGGSTEAFVRGLRENPGSPTMYCMEISKARFAELKDRYKSDAFVKCYNVSSVSLGDFPSKAEVKKFYSSTKTNLNQYPLEQVLGWLQQDIEYVKGAGVEQDGIRIIREDSNIQNFDLVLIDGSEFTGSAELNKIYGAKYILLDDINAFKNHSAYFQLANDPNYTLIKENWDVRNGYAIFKFDDTALPVHFFTLVLNGEPFIRYHIDLLKQLPFRWHWHIIEGVAELTNDTAWSVPLGGKVSSRFHKNGLSIDGTSAYISELAEEFPDNVTVYRKDCGAFWDGKLEMVNAPLKNIGEEVLLFEIDSDELWTFEQILNVRNMFLDNPSKTAAFFWCHFYVGESLVTTEKNQYSKTPAYEWIRAWRYKPGYRWMSHEPPALCMKNDHGEWVDLTKVNPFRHDETEKRGLVFHHYAYVLEKQLEFKEVYYGYRNALADWRRLQDAEQFPVLLREYFAWVNDSQRVNTVEAQQITPIARKDEKGSWTYNYVCGPISTEQCNLDQQAGGRKRRDGASKDRILIDGVIFYLQRERPFGIYRVWQELLTELAKTDLAKDILLLDRSNTAPYIPGIETRSIHDYDHFHFEADSLYLEDVCREENAALFISTYLTYPENFYSVVMLHDMIPEVRGLDLADPAWRAKVKAIEKARAYFIVSESTRHDFHKWFPQFKKRPAYLIPNAVGDKFKPHNKGEISRFRQKYNITKPYYMLAGNRMLYKNAIQFFKAFALLENAYEYEIVCAGGASNLEDIFGQYLRNTNCQVHFFTDEELSLAYSGAVALVYPSLYEGFGLPILEAMQSGCPVITCKNSSIPEVAGDAAIYVQETDVEDMRKALRRVQKPGCRARLIKKGLANAARFCWHDSAKKMRHAIQDVVKRVAGTPLRETDPIGTEKRLVYFLNKQQGSSPLVQAMVYNLSMFTGSRLFDHRRIDQNEHAIAAMDDTVFDMMRREFSGPTAVSAVFCYWFGLALHFRGRHLEAVDAFIKSFERNVRHRWRVGYLGSVAAVAAGNLEAAELLIKDVVLREFPNYKPALEKLSELKTRSNQALSGPKGTASAKPVVQTESAVVAAEPSTAPLVSAIVSTYNAERFIRGCLEDLQAQTIAEQLEIIVIDSGSTQREADIVREFQQRFSNIRYIRTAQREGVYAAWNRGIKLARGKYITNANTDDRHRRDAFEKMVTILEANADIALVYANVYITKTENETFERHTRTGSFRWHDFDVIRLVEGCYIGPQPMWRRCLHDTYGFFDERYESAGDWEFWLRLARREKFFHLDEFLGLYLQSADSVEHRDPDLSIREAKEIQKKYWPVREQEIDKLYRRAVALIEDRRIVDGLQLLSVLLEYEPAHVETLALMGDIYADLGEQSKARQMWELVLQQQPKNKAVQEKLQRMTDTVCPTTNHD